MFRWEQHEGTKAGSREEGPVYVKDKALFLFLLMPFARDKVSSNNILSYRTGGLRQVTSLNFRH